MSDNVDLSGALNLSAGASKAEIASAIRALAQAKVSAITPHLANGSPQPASTPAGRSDLGSITNPHGDIYGTGLNIGGNAVPISGLSDAANVKVINLIDNGSFTWSYDYYDALYFVIHSAGGSGKGGVGGCLNASSGADGNNGNSGGNSILTIGSATANIPGGQAGNSNVGYMPPDIFNIITSGTGWFGIQPPIFIPNGFGGAPGNDSGLSQGFNVGGSVTFNKNNWYKPAHGRQYIYTIAKVGINKGDIISWTRGLGGLAATGGLGTSGTPNGGNSKAGQNARCFAIPYKD